MESPERQFEGMTPEEIKSLVNARFREVQDLLETTRMQGRRRSKLLGLLQDCFGLVRFSVERRESLGMTPEVYALHISSLYQDDVSFRADHEKIVGAFMTGGAEALNTMTLKDREIINLMCRGTFASVLLLGILQRSLDETAIHDNIVTDAKQSQEQNDLSKLLESFSPALPAHFDESSFDGDTKTALRALLIDAWNKRDGKYFAEVCSEALAAIAHLAGFRECPPQLGQDQIAR